MIIGCHVNFTKEQLLGSAKQAIEYGGNAFMFYTGAPQNTIRKTLDKELTKKAWEYMNENGIELKNVICHAPYIVNLANNKEEEKWQFSISFLKQEIKRCEELGISYIVVHPGSAVGLPKEEALNNISEALKNIVTDNGPMLLLETMAGKGTECGNSLEEIKYLLDHIPSKNIGVCLDTCHLNDAGYDLNNWHELLSQIDQLIGLERIHCIHLNDSKNPLASHKDRHENFGFGTIGFQTLYTILKEPKLKEVPKILETPYVDKLYPPYKFEIESLKKGEFNSNLIEEIRQYYK